MSTVSLLHKEENNLGIRIENPYIVFEGKDFGFLNDLQLKKGHLCLTDRGFNVSSVSASRSVSTSLRRWLLTLYARSCLTVICEVFDLFCRFLCQCDLAVLVELTSRILLFLHGYSALDVLSVPPQYSSFLAYAVGCGTDEQQSQIISKIEVVPF